MSTSRAIIRPIFAEDFSQWKLLWDGYNAFYNRVGPTAVSDEMTQTTWQRFLDPSEPMFALVAEVDGKLVGLTHYLFHRNTNMMAHDCYLQDLFTHPDFRGLRIGEELIRAVSEKAKEHGSKRVYWQTHEGNATARKLYDRIAKHAGFITYSQNVSQNVGRTFL